MKAVIEWISAEGGGRLQLPSGNGQSVYSPIVRFLDQPWPGDIAWSLAVTKLQSNGTPRRWLAEVDFRVEDAPRDELRVGRRFELYEGSKCVAHGRLGESGQLDGSDVLSTR